MTYRVDIIGDEVVGTVEAQIRALLSEHGLYDVSVNYQQKPDKKEYVVVTIDRTVHGWVEARHRKLILEYIGSIYGSSLNFDVQSFMLDDNEIDFIVDDKQPLNVYIRQRSILR